VENGSIGDAGIDHQRAQAAVARQVLAAQRHRRRAAAVLGEHAGGTTARRQFDQRQVAPVFLADAGFGRAKAHAGNGEKSFGGGGGVIDGHDLGRRRVVQREAQSLAACGNPKKSALTLRRLKGFGYRRGMPDFRELTEG
jgi:hypothetical protein